jgi:hypothetical protein
MLATLNNDRTAGGTKPAVQSVVATVEVPANDYLVSGQQTLSIDIVR